METSELDKLIYARIAQWKERLIDLSRRNKLIYFKDTRNLLFIESPSIKEIFEQFVIKEKSFGFWYPTLPVDLAQLGLFESTEKDEIPNRKSPKTREFKTHVESHRDLQRILRNLRRRSQLDHRERGVRVLHLALGMLHWTEVEYSEEEIRSPLILCPVELSYDRSKNKFTLALVDDEEIRLNPALQAKLQNDFQLILPELPEEFVELDDYFDKVARTVQDRRWNLEKSVLLNLFSFHKLVMYHDLDQYTDIIASHPLVRVLVGGSLPERLLEEPPSEEELDQIEAPEDSYQILDADSSQRRCIQMAIRGQSFVIQGPPGTGKSQTIANVIAECLARGKTVLFVSEKMAALEVVYERLQETQLDEFCLELHSRKTSKKEVASRLDQCLREQLQPRELPTESDFQLLKRRCYLLNQYVLALHQERRPLGRSVFQVFGELAKLHKITSVPYDWTNLAELTDDYLQTWEQILKRLEPVWYITQEGEDFPWYGCLEREYSLTVAQRWDEMLENAQQRFEKWLNVADVYAKQIGISSPQYVTDIEFLCRLADLLSQPQVAEPTWFTENTVALLLKKAQELSPQTEKYRTIRNTLVKTYGNSFFDLPSGLGEQLKTLWDICYLLFSEDQTKTVYLRVKPLIDFFIQTRKMLDRCLPIAQKWQQKWQVLTDDLNIDRMTDLAELAVYCGTKTLRPLSDWLDLSVWKHVDQFVAEIEPDHTEYRQRRNRLLKNYDKDLLTLPIDELDELIDRFDSLIQNSFLWWFFPKFRQDRKLVRRLSLTGTILPSIHEDLVEARNLLRFYNRYIESCREKATQLLGSYYEGIETDFEALQESLCRARQIFKLAQTDSIPQPLRQQLAIDSPVSQELAAQGQNVLNQINQWTSSMNELFADLSETPSLDTITVDELQEWIDTLQPRLQDLHDALSEILEISEKTANKTIDKLITDIKAKEQAEQIDQEFTRQMDKFKKMFGERFQGVDTDWQALIAALKWSNQLIHCFTEQQMPEKLVQYACKTERTTEDRLFKADKNFREIVNKLRKYFEPPYPKTLLRNLRTLSLEKLQRYFGQWYERREELRAWIDFHDIQQRFADQNLGAFFEQLRERVEAKSELVPAFRRSLLQAWVEYQVSQDERLRTFRGQYHERLIQEFREIDRKLIEMARQRVIELCNKHRPAGGISAAESEVGLLRREGLRQRGHLPIRRLFDRISNLLLRLKPCLMMSPISVAKFINPDLFKFDLVIFDEASQIFPEDAIGAIYRGQQVIVVGDNKQLPPTYFFQKTVDDSDDDEDTVLLESILDEFDAGLPKGFKPLLRWHYRSRRESLIAFSNHRFYGGKLITFPSTQIDDFKEGIQFVHVPDGVYARGGRRDNQREADVVVDLIFEHFRKSPDLSLGVVTFNRAQMNTIEDKIERRLRNQSEFTQFFNREGLDSFFVKNLENVQGDERDVMLFSIGYGEDSHGRFTMNFGPLNRDGGERRLNVAITRAREKVIVVSSFRYADMNLERIDNKGVLSLYHYLRYVELGPKALELNHPQGEGPPESPLEEDVASEIRSLGYDVVTQVGCSGYRIDLAVVDPAQPGRFILGVECDGAMYHSAKTARDRDRIRQEVLEGMGWKIHRIWAPDWRKQRKREINRLKEAIKRARVASPDKTQKVSDPVEPPIVERETISSSEQRPELEHYHPLILGQRFPPDTFHNPEYRQELCQVLVEVVKQEGPIHVELVTRRLMSAWGFSRKGRLIEQTVDTTIEYCLRKEMIKQKGTFLWPTEKPPLPSVPEPKIADSKRKVEHKKGNFLWPNEEPSLPRVPDPKIADSKRKVEHISPEELGAAMLRILQGSVGIGIESLFKETLKLFGFQHVTDSRKPYLQQALDQLQASGRCRVDGDRVYHFRSA